MPFIPNKKDMSRPACAREVPWIFKTKQPELIARLNTELDGSDLIQKLCKKHEANMKANAKANEKARAKAEADEKRALSQPKKKARLSKESATLPATLPLPIAAPTSQELASAVLSTSVTGFYTRSIQTTANCMVANPRQVFYTSAADQYDRMLL